MSWPRHRCSLSRRSRRLAILSAIHPTCRPQAAHHPPSPHITSLHPFPPVFSRSQAIIASTSPLPALFPHVFPPPWCAVFLLVCWSVLIPPDRGLCLLSCHASFCSFCLSALGNALHFSYTYLPTTPISHKYSAYGRIPPNTKGTRPSPSHPTCLPPLDLRELSDFTISFLLPPPVP